VFNTSQELGSDARWGTIQLFRLWGIPVSAHWSLPVGGLLMASYAGTDWRGALCCCIAFALLILVHELGHAAAAASLGLKVHSVHVSGLGGRCLFETPRSVRGAFFVCSGGLIAQLIVFAFAVTYIALFGWPKSILGVCIVNTFTIANAVLFALNIFPQNLPRGVVSDGSLLWKLFLHAVRGHANPWPRVSATSPVLPPDTSLLARADMKPAGFKVGIEILNDEKTPMAFVVWTLMKNLDVDQRQATMITINVHNEGGIVLPLADMQEATRVAKGVTDDCLAHNQPLVCRAIQARYEAE
jgi:ATP-dependent Clp protease adapter protein ClpS